jgi:hypothetical protein
MPAGKINSRIIHQKKMKISLFALACESLTENMIFAVVISLDGS